jgi:uncharacterized membrane protein (DUF485 family)
MPSRDDILRSPELERLVRRRWVVSITLTAALFVVYYGFVLLIALAPDVLARRVGEHTTLGIPIGAAVIVLSWVLTCLYVLWANGPWDRGVRSLRDRLHN